MRDARRIYLHVGLQKTGTSYLQAALLRSARSLAGAGLDLVPPTKQESFELMVVVRERYQDRRDVGSEGVVLKRFSDRLARAAGSRAVYSQESLAAATPEQIDRLLEACAGREVHVVATVRDLARQLPSAWQEDLKAGATLSFDDYLRRLQKLERRERAGQPWIHLDPPEVLRRWSAVVPTERLHVVTVPSVGAPRTLLLERFARVLDVDPALFAPEEQHTNSSLGLVQAEVLRRVNLDLPEEVHRRFIYSEVVKRGFGRSVLAQQEGARAILVPGEFRDWCEDVAGRQVEALRAAGYPVEGDLGDLLPSGSAFATDPDVPTEPEVATAAVSALVAILTERGRARGAQRSGRIGVEQTGLRARVLRRLRR